MRLAAWWHVVRGALVDHLEVGRSQSRLKLLAHHNLNHTTHLQSTATLFDFGLSAEGQDFSASYAND